MSAVFDTDTFKSRRINLCRFTNGRLKGEESNQLTTRVLTKSDRNVETHDKTILVSESPYMTYTGQNFGRKCLNKGSKTTKYYVGVFDEKSRKMRVCDAELFQMTPFTPGLTEDDDVEQIETIKPTEFREKISMLTEAFGSKRKKSALEKSRRNKLDDDTIKHHLAADIDHGKQQVKARQAVQNQETAPSVLDINPPCNKGAENVEDVYNFSDILTDMDLEVLHGPATVFFDSTVHQINTWRKEEKYPSYVLNHVESMPLEPVLRWKRSKCLMYLTYMIALFKKKRHEFKGKDLYQKDCPALIQKKLNDNFTKSTNNIRCMPSRQKDRLASYILTLCLLIDEFHINLNVLVIDLGMQREKLFPILKLLGCRINKKLKDDQVTYSARLKLPLDFPHKPLFKQRGGKGR